MYKAKHALPKSAMVSLHYTPKKIQIQNTKCVYCSLVMILQKAINNKPDYVN